MSCNGCTACAALPDELQPYGREIAFDGIFVKEMRIPIAGTIVPQHSHSYAHVSYLAKGSALVEADGLLPITYHAPASIPIPALIKHRFTSQEDDTLILCIHRDRNGAAVHEEHQIVGEV